METERIALSQRERDRLQALHEVQQKQLTQLAAAVLVTNDRSFRRLTHLKIEDWTPWRPVSELPLQPGNVPYQQEQER